MAEMTGWSLFVLVLLGCVSGSVAGERGSATTIAFSIIAAVCLVFFLIAIIGCCATDRSRFSNCQIVRTTKYPAFKGIVFSTNTSRQHPVYAYDQPPQPPPQPMRPPPHSSTQGATRNPRYPRGQRVPHTAGGDRHAPNPGGSTGNGYWNPVYLIEHQPPQATGRDSNA